MNQQSNKKHERFTTPIIFGLLSAVSCWVLLDGRVHPDAARWIWLAAMVCLLMRFSLAIYVVTGLSLVWPLIAVRRFAFQIRAMPIDLMDIEYALTLLAFVFFAFRFIDSMTQLRQNSIGEMTPASNRLPVASQWMGFSGVWMIPVAVMAAMSLLTLFPENLASRQFIRLTPGGLRAVTFIWLLGIAWVVIYSGFSLAGWFRMNADQASLYIRSCFSREIRREMARIERSRARQLGRDGPGV